MRFNLLYLKENLTQILAIAEKNIKLDARFRFRLFMSFFMPIIGIIMPLIVMNSFMSYNATFGPWNPTNFAVYQILAYDISVVSEVRNRYTSDLNREKNWLTLSALIIAPFSRMNLLLGIFISHITLMTVPFLFFFIFCFIYYPIHFLTILGVLFFFLLLALFFSGLGLIIGVFAISNENVMNGLNFIIGLLFYFSCIIYPFELFPEAFQAIINYNPLFYIFDLIRLTWIEDSLGFSIVYHLQDFLILLIGACILPIIGVIVFNKVYKKYGIVGY